MIMCNFFNFYCFFIFSLIGGVAVAVAVAVAVVVVVELAADTVLFLLFGKLLHFFLDTNEVIIFKDAVTNVIT